MINDTHDESIKMIFANPTITESQISWEQKQSARKQKLQCSKKQKIRRANKSIDIFNQKIMKKKHKHKIGKPNAKTQFTQT